MHMDGVGPSILVDQHGVTIAGAGGWEAATHYVATDSGVLLLRGRRA